MKLTINKKNSCLIFLNHDFSVFLIFFRIISSGRHLWLRFRSDENIEYEGFHAVYKFIKKPPPGINKC